MRIAVISSPYIPVPPHKYGGTERVIYYLVKGLVEKGHQVTLFATGDSTIQETVACELVPICERHLFFGRTAAEHEQIERQRRAIDQQVLTMLRQQAPRFDIIHSHGFDLVTLSDLPTVTTLHGSFTFEQMDYYEARSNLNYVSISKNQQRPFPDLEYVGVAYNGLDPTEFPLVTEPDDYVCFLGRFDRDKSPHLAIQLALQWGVPIKLAGKLDHLGEHYFAEEIEPHLSNPQVEYLGELDMAQKIALLSRAKANLHPTNFREPFGLTVLEAAYCGTPTVAVRRGAMAEIIENERSGLLVEDFVEAYHWRDMCFNLDRAYVSQRARMLFNYHTMTEQYLAAYQKVQEKMTAVVVPPIISGNLPWQSADHLLRVTPGTA